VLLKDSFSSPLLNTFKYCIKILKSQFVIITKMKDTRKLDLNKRNDSLQSYLEYICLNKDREKHEDNVDVNQHQTKLPAVKKKH